jgi:hypothetical protein
MLLHDLGVAQAILPARADKIVCATLSGGTRIVAA